MDLIDYGSVDEEDRNQIGTTKSVKGVALLYAWGKNQDGELALGSIKNISEPKPLKSGVGYAKQIASAYSHSCLVNSDGQLFVTGSMLLDKLGLDLQHTSISRFHVQKHLQGMKVKQVACGTYHTMALLENGQLYAWGGTLWNQTGQKSGKVCPVYTLQSHKIVDIACGESHSLALSDKGDVYSWGGGGSSSNKGQLGQGSFKDFQNPELIQALKGKKVRKIHSGDYHCMALTQNDELYSWGQGMSGQLGGQSKDNSHTPKKITITYNQNLMLEEYFRSDSVKETAKISQIALGGKHSLLLTNKGHLYVCGYGSQGQLGLGPGKNCNVYEPTLVNGFVGKRIIMVGAGSNHSIALTDKFNVYSCGYNVKGQLGVGDQKSRTVWTHINKLAGKKITRVYAGGNHSWAVLDQNYPTIQDYQPPSPIIMSVQADEGFSRSGQIPKHDTKSAVSNLTFIQALEEMSSNKSTLEVIYTDVDKHHRFIRFFLKQESQYAKDKLQEYINYCYQIEKQSLKYHVIRHDTDLFDASGQLISHADRRNVTLMMISDCAALSVKETIKPQQKVGIPIGQLLIYKESQLRSDGKILPQNRWFFKFNELFQGLIDRSRILELRPKQ